MSFIRNNFTRGSFPRRPVTFGEGRDVDRAKHVDDCDACYETYRHHCAQLEEAITAHNKKTVLFDDFELIICNHLEHLVSLVSNDLKKTKTGAKTSPCLDHFLNKNISSRVCIWSLENNHERLSLAVAEAIDSLLATAKKVEKDIDLLRNPSFHEPICLLFSKYEETKMSGEGISSPMETILISISYYVCVFVVREPSYIELFYELATVANQPKFPMMTLLIRNLHESGPRGQTSRDNLKLLMALAKEQQLLAQFMALHSDLCPVVASVLSALFSRLPRSLPEKIERAGMLSAVDVETLKEVESFVTSLEFCDSILDTSSWLIATHLLDMCHKGFLVPVLGPALFQNTMKEILAATCYLTLMIRSIRNRGLIGIFVRFLLMNTHEEKPIIEFLISRMTAQTELRLATLNLFYALINLNCEDIILSLVMRYLLPCTHVMLSQRGDILQESDINCLWAAKFLSLIPNACSDRALSSKGSADFQKLNLQESEPLARIRSWSRASVDSGERKYGQLAFTAIDHKLSSCERTTLSDNLFSEINCSRLRNYMRDEVIQIRSCANATRYWTYCYNGLHPPVNEAKRMLYYPDSLGKTIYSPTDSAETSVRHGENINDVSVCPPQYPQIDPSDVYMFCMEQLSSCLSEIKSDIASPGKSSGYFSASCNVQPLETLKEESSFFSKEVQDDLEFWSLMRDDDFDSTPAVTPVMNQNNFDIHYTSVPTIGPFLEQLVKSVDGWLNNSTEVNLMLCSILTRLATYTHPLLRSLILNPYLILQPSIPSLSVAIATLKQRIDSALRVHENSELLIEEARTSLQTRMFHAVKSNGLPLSISRETKSKPSRLASIFGSFVRKDFTESIKENPEQVTGSNQHANRRMEGSDPIGNHVAICAVLLEEWLLELAALCMEHSVQFTPCCIPLTQL